MPAIGRGTRPKSLVEHLSEQAPKRPVNDIVGINRYLFSARLLLNQAMEYRAIGNEEQLYVILLRFASLVVETIPQHRDFKAGVPAYTGLKRDLVERYLPELERLKAALRLRDRPEPPAPHSTNRPSDAVPLSASDLPQIDWAASGAPVAAASAAAAATAGVVNGRSGGASLQVDDLLEVMRGGPPTAALPGPPTAPALASYGSFGASSSDPYAVAAAASASLAAASAAAPADIPPPKYAHAYAAPSGRHALFATTSAPSVGRAASSGPERAGGFGALPRYPTLDSGGSPQAGSSAAAAAAAVDLAALSVTPQPSAGPSLGPQEVAVLSMPANTAGLPDTCTHTPTSSSTPPPPPPQPSTSSTSPQPPAGGPKELAKRAQLRDVHVSVALMEEFLAYARSNTSAGIESCGILAGKLLAGDSTFAITTLIIPKQQGTSDTVQALNEEEIFEAQFERELYPLGWIHTHPTQTCFLSSVDVHTQCGYQTMLDEAVAIVMAPTDRSKRCGIFRLSTPGGLRLVQRCPQRGFHTHPPPDTGQELYELCGHVYVNPRTKHEVLDLR